MIAGVCGGLAEYLGMDATIVRVIYALLVLFGGVGILLYIILALLMPKAE
jgi:phage shock protein PspC (stress-responsive transcriptional regulator)